MKAQLLGGPPSYLLLSTCWESTRARVRGGTGLGLSIALEDARLHNGELDAWGALGHGAHFVLTLPIVAGSQISGRPIRPQPKDYPQSV